MNLSPTQALFTAFVRNEMGISTGVLPDDSQYLMWAYQQSLATVNQQIALASPLLYLVAVNNLAGDLLINLAQDVPDAPPVTGSNPPAPFFAYTRRQLNINSFVTGVIASTSDEGTSESMVVPDFVKTLTLGDLQNLKTPWGQKYISIALSVGTDWGLS